MYGLRHGELSLSYINTRGIVFGLRWGSVLGATMGEDTVFGLRRVQRQKGYLG